MIITRPVRGIRGVDRKVSQYYGENIQRYKEITNGLRNKGHEGLDYIYLTSERTIYSGTAGICKRTGYDDGGFGHYVIISNELYDIFYAHLSSCSVLAGDIISVSQPIGIMGNSGLSTGTHLHLGVKKDGKRIDPTSMIRDWVSNDDYIILKQAQDDGVRNGIGGLASRSDVVLMIYRSLRLR